MFIVDEQGKIAYKHGNPMSMTFDDTDSLAKALDEVGTAA